MGIKRTVTGKIDYYIITFQMIGLRTNINFIKDSWSAELKPLLQFYKETQRMSLYQKYGNLAKNLSFGIYTIGHFGIYTSAVDNDLSPDLHMKEEQLQWIAISHEETANQECVLQDLIINKIKVFLAVILKRLATINSKQVFSTK